MKKTKKLLTKTGKLLLVISFVFSQLSSPLSVLAEEVGNNITDENQEENLLLDNTDDEIIDEQVDEINNPDAEEIEPINELDEDNNLEADDQPEQDDLEGEEDPEVTPNFTVEIVDEEDSKLYIIKNELEKTITVKQLKENNSDVTTVIDEEEVEITDETTTIKSGYQVTITKEPETPEEEVVPVTYTIILLGDYNADGMVNEEDKELLLELSKAELEDEFLNENMPLLDLNKDEIFNVLDVTYPIFTSGTWENEKVATDELENYLMSSEEEVYLEDEKEIKVEYYVEGFNVDSLVGIEGKLNYDETLVELTKIEVNGTEQDIEKLVNNKFVYLLDNYNEDGALLILTFKALAVGEPVISIENIVASLGGVAANLDVEKVSTTFNVLEYGKGGDEEITPPAPEEPVVIPTIPTPVVLSTDNDLKVLTIEGYDIAFNPNTYEYTIKVKNDVTSLNISALLSSSKAIYYVEGNENFEVGENLVYVVVKAENGSTKTYTIRVEKEKEEVIVEKDNKDDEEKDTEEKDEEKNTSKTVIIILIILVIIGLIYVIFKDDEEDKQEAKKETPKEPVKIKEIKPTKETNSKKETEKPVKKNNQNNKKNTKKGSKK